jgi:hypothetical protein
MPNVGNVTMKFSILKGGPQGQQVGVSTTAYLEWGGEMIGAEWPGDGVPVEPGAVYFLKVERTDGQGVYLYATDSNPYSQGTAFTGTTPRASWDLFATIRGATLAVDSKLGVLVGSVHDETNAPLAGASVSAAPAPIPRRRRAEEVRAPFPREPTKSPRPWTATSLRPSRRSPFSKDRPRSSTSLSNETRSRRRLLS